MLEVRPSKDAQLNKNLASLCGLGEMSDYAFVLFEDDCPIGIASLKIDLTSTIEKVGIIPEKRGKKNGDFFTRVLIYKLTLVAKVVRIGYQSAYFVPFGFVDKGGYMECKSENITFPHNCGGEC